MRHRRQSGGRETRTRRWSAVLIVAVAVLVGTTWIAAQEPAAQPAQRPATRPLREPPGLLSAPEVVKGLTARHRNLRDRFLAHEQRRSHCHDAGQQGQHDDRQHHEADDHADQPLEQEDRDEEHPLQEPQRQQDDEEKQLQRQDEGADHHTENEEPEEQKEPASQQLEHRQ